MKNLNKISLLVNKTLIWVVVMVLSVSSAFAADDPGALPDAPDDTAAAPIDGYVWVLALVGLFFVFMKFRSIQKNRIQN